jgi:hypothetical protein
VGEYILSRFLCGGHALLLSTRSAPASGKTEKRGGGRAQAGWHVYRFRACWVQLSDRWATLRARSRRAQAVGSCLASELPDGGLDIDISYDAARSRMEPVLWRQLDRATTSAPALSNNSHTR